MLLRVPKVSVKKYKKESKMANKLMQSNSWPVSSLCSESTPKLSKRSALSTKCSRFRLLSSQARSKQLRSSYKDSYRLSIREKITQEQKNCICTLSIRSISLTLASSLHRKAKQYERQLLHKLLASNSKSIRVRRLIRTQRLQRLALSQPQRASKRQNKRVKKKRFSLPQKKERN